MTQILSKNLDELRKKLSKAANNKLYSCTGWAIIKTQRWQDAITQERRHRLSCGFAR